MKGISDNITVRSIVDRFLEHSRIFYFENACQSEILVGSADWMPRNFQRRIEIIFPVLDGNLRERIRTEILELALVDNRKARFLNANGTYSRPALRGGGSRRSQAELIARSIGENGLKKSARQRSQYPTMKIAPKPTRLKKER